MEPSTTIRNSSGHQMDALVGLLQDVFRPLLQEVMASGRQGQAVPPPEFPQKDFLRPKEVEAIYGLNHKTLACWRSQGRGPTYSKEGDLVLYRRQDLEAYLKTRRVRTGEQPGLK
jgi:hypothetical protein